MREIISLIFGFIEFVIGLRFVFLLLGAHLENGFVAWIINVSSPLITPFGTIFGHTAQVVSGGLPGSYFEMASLIALVVYGLIGGVLLRITSRNSQ